MSFTGKCNSNNNSGSKVEMPVGMYYQKNMKYRPGNLTDVSQHTVKAFCRVPREKSGWSSAVNVPYKSTMQYVLRIGCSTPPLYCDVYSPILAAQTT